LSSTITDSRTTFQLLSAQVELDYEDPALAETFRYIAACPEQPLQIRKFLRYRISGTGPYLVEEEGDALESVVTRDDVLYLVYERVYARTLERFFLSGWVLIHGAVATIGRQRVLLLGNKGAGKSTLSSRLLYAGHAVEGDESVLERGGQFLPLPRAFHLKPGIEKNIPELADQLPAMPLLPIEGGSHVTSMDPVALGFEWAIRCGPMDAVIWITPNHGGETELRAYAPFQMIQRTLESILAWQLPRQELVGLAARLGGAGGYELQLGDATSAVGLLAKEFASDT
jgi:hypothetical protein